jgi:hypothetical protein
MACGNLSFKKDNSKIYSPHQAANTAALAMDAEAWSKGAGKEDGNAQ